VNAQLVKTNAETSGSSASLKNAFPTTAGALPVIENRDTDVCRPRLLYFTASPQPLPFLAGLPTYLAPRGFRTHVVSSPQQLLWDFCGREGCTPHAMRTSRSITPLRDAVSVVQLWRTLRRVRPAIVECQMSKAGLIGMVASWLARVPVRIYNNQGVAFSSAIGWRKILLKASEWVTCHLATQVHCASPSVRDVIVSAGCCREDKIFVLANGSYGVDAKQHFNPQHFGPNVRHQVRQSLGIPQEAPVLGFVGRIAALKGIDDLGQAWQAVKRSHPQAHLLIVGGPDPRNPVLPQTDTMLRNDPQVRLVGEVVDPAPLYSAMDLQVLPSIHEGLPISLLEGAAMQLPIVASRIPGNVDAVEDGATGTLFPVHDVEALAAAISAYLQDPALRSTHGRAGRERILRNFQRETVWEATCAEYMKLLRRAGIEPPRPVSTTVPTPSTRRLAA
jgi:glycosyltransferase involved in cell wall biosynthesis